MENKSTEVKMGKMPSKREVRKSAREERSSSYELTETLAMWETKLEPLHRQSDKQRVYS